jgi:rRNA-processing protein FCF1
VVLDGRQRDVGTPRHVEVEFAPQGGRNAADAVIGARVEADPAPADLMVVTSDRELADRVTAAGARVQPAKAFRERLNGH